jgi:hypothetical protein
MSKFSCPSPAPGTCPFISDEDFAHDNIGVTDPNTRLILWRLKEVENKLAARDAEIFRRLNSLEKWRTTLLGAWGMICIIALAVWQILTKKG